MCCSKFSVRFAARSFAADSPWPLLNEQIRATQSAVEHEGQLEKYASAVGK